MAAWVTAFAPGHAAAQRPMNPEAKIELDRGLDRFRTHDYSGAIAAFDAGFAIDPHPDFLYARGQAQRLSGACAAAIESYQAFMASGPPAREAELARYNIGRCEAELRARAARTRRESGLPADRRPLPPDPGGRTSSGPMGRPTPFDLVQRKDRSAQRVWYRDPAGGALTAGGLAGLAAGVTLLIVADGRVERASQEEDLAEYESERRGASTLRKVGAISMAGGVVLATAAAIRYLRISARAPAPALQVEGSAGTGAAFLLIRARF